MKTQRNLLQSVEFDLQESDVPRQRHLQKPRCAKAKPQARDSRRSSSPCHRTRGRKPGRDRVGGGRLCSCGLGPRLGATQIARQQTGHSQEQQKRRVRRMPVGSEATAWPSCRVPARAAAPCWGPEGASALVLALRRVCLARGTGLGLEGARMAEAAPVAPAHTQRGHPKSTLRETSRRSARGCKKKQNNVCHTSRGTSRLWLLCHSCVGCACWVQRRPSRGPPVTGP